MTGQAVVLPGRLALVADHLVLALRDDPADAQPSFVLSWYAVAWSAVAPGGHLAFVRSPLLPEGELVITDTPALDRAMRARLAPKSWPLARPDRAAVVGRFERAPVRDVAVESRIDTDGHVVEATWRDLGAPLVATGRVGTDAPWDTSTVLIEAGSWTAAVDGRPVSGVAFPNHVWDAWFGRPLSSALVAIAEVFREVGS